jgi:hypothetical protein
MTVVHAQVSDGREAAIREGRRVGQGTAASISASLPAQVATPQSVIPRFGAKQRSACPSRTRTASASTVTSAVRRNCSDQYPTPDALRAITMQGLSQRPTLGQVLRPVLAHAPASLRLWPHQRKTLLDHQSE